MIYLLIFILSLGCLGVSFVIKNKRLSTIFEFLSIMIPCIFAGLRGDKVGTDLLIYIKPNYNMLSNFNSVFEIFQKFSDEYLYWIITYFFSNYIQNFKLYLFFLEFLVIFPIFLSLKKISKNSMDMFLGMFIFFMFFYNISYNMARQSIAISFVVLALTYLDKEEKTKCIIATIIAFLFHTSAIIILPVYFIYIINKSKLPYIIKIFANFIVIVIMLLFTINFEYIMTIISSNESFIYGNYIDKYLLTNKSVGWVRISIWLFLIFVTIGFKKSIKREIKNYNFYFLISLMTLAGFYLNTIILYSERIFYYLMFPFVFIVVSKIPGSIKNKEWKILAFCAIIIVFGAYWYYSIPYNNWNNTLPYYFSK